MLLGEAWKSLPLEERESYSTKAKVMADEQKKIYPDCWKRKKTVASSGSGGTPSSGSSSNANHGETSLTIKNSTQTSLQMPPLIHQQPPPPLEVVANSAAQRMDTSLDIVWKELKRNQIYLLLLLEKSIYQSSDEKISRKEKTLLLMEDKF